jgi:hypothetical protein
VWVVARDGGCAAATLGSGLLWAGTVLCRG